MMSAERIARFLRPFAFGTLAIFLLAFAVESPLESRFAEYPRKPVGEYQIAYHWKSTVIYITPSDSMKVSAAHAAWVVGGLVLAICIAAGLVAQGKASR